MSTSIPLEIYPPKKDVVRFVDFLNLFKYYICIIMSWRPYNEFPNPDDNLYFLGHL